MKEIFWAVEMINPNSFTRLKMGCKVGNRLSRYVTWYSLQEATMLIESDQESYNWINAQCMVLIITNTLWVWWILIKSTLCTAALHQATLTTHIDTVIPYKSLPEWIYTPTMQQSALTTPPWFTLWSFVREVSWNKLATTWNIITVQ